MKLALVAALTVAATALAQSTSHRPGHVSHPAPKPSSFTDPANLRGERVSPLTGRELPVDKGTLGLQQLLRKLNTRASLMLIVAHPDDEDGGMLTYYSRGLGARVATLTLTRGEGGQNAMTGDFEDALGLIRTQELLSADRYMGVDQFFGTEVDFGFSKTKEEAFGKWTHQRVLYDAVRAVRLYRPLVIAAVFIGGVTDGHGQHQVSGEIAQEVFNAAGDPRIFPELTAQGILPWQPLKVYARVPAFAITDKGLFDYATGQYAPARFTNYVTGETTTTPPTPDVTVHEGQTDPLLTYAAANPSDLRTKSADRNAPLSYVQFARIGLGLQKTQIGPNVRVPPAGTYNVAYHLYGSRLCGAPSSVISTGAKRSGETCVPPAPATTSAATQIAKTASFFDGIDTSILGLQAISPAMRTDLVPQLASEIRSAADHFDPKHPEATAPTLAQALKTDDELINVVETSKIDPIQKQNILHELRIKRVQLNQALALALNLQIDVTTDSPTPELQAGKAVNLHVNLTTTAAGTIPYQQISVENSTGERYDILTNEDQTASITAHKPAQEPIELDADLARHITRPYFSRPSIEQPFYDLREPELRNAPATPPAITAWADLTYRGTTIHLGRVVHIGDQPASLTPPATLSLSAHAQVLAEDGHTALFSTFLYPVAKPAAIPQIAVPPAWKTSFAVNDTAAPGETEFKVTAPAFARSPITLKASAKVPNDGTVTEGFRPVGYPGIPFTNYFTPATDRIVPVDLKLPAHRRIAYLPGTGDAVPQALASITLRVTELTVADLTPAKLSHFDTVILGVRTYHAHDLHGAPTQALLEFGRNGGNVIVQYQISDFTSADAPFPLDLGSTEKVVDETAPVALPDPASPALTSPNHITIADFNGWVEERGHGFLFSWDPHYTALTETHDPGQAPQKGGLITTSLGRGHWTYCAFALYRQVPEAVPGAFRLLVNLLGLADIPAR